jgi:hypothetical protein
LPDEAPIEVRSAFMGARGFWSLHPEPLGASAKLSEDGSTLIVSLRDPAQLVARVLVHVRGEGQAGYAEYVLAPNKSLSISLSALPNRARVEYTLALLDENANRVWFEGSDAQPEQLLGPGVLLSATPAPESCAQLPAPDRRAPRPYYWGAGASFALAAGLAAGAGYAHWQRQQFAARWNEGHCHGGGVTRGSICAHERDRLDHFEHLAVGLYAASAASLIGGAAALLLAPARGARREAEVARPSAWRCQRGPGQIGVGCATSF